MYHFKVAYKHEDKRRKGAWHRVSIDGDKPLWDLDQALRKAFGYELDDHLSRFTIRGYNFVVSPDIESDCGPMKINGFSLRESEEIEWVWDLGDWWEHIIVCCV